MFRVYREYYIEDYYRVAANGGWVFTEKEDAINFKDKLNNDHKIAYDLAQDLNKKIAKKDLELRKKLPELKILPIPKWKAGIRMDEITPEMRAERDQLKQKNEKRIKAHNKLLSNLYTKIDNYKIKLLKEHPDIEFLHIYLNSCKDQIEYGIDEVEFKPLLNMELMK